MISSMHIASRQDVTYLDKILLDENGLLKPVPYREICDFPGVHLIQWANTKGVYCIPTTELIHWLQNRINGRKAIEICAGYGAIGRALNIVSTDSYIQTRPEIAITYILQGQNPIQPLLMFTNLKRMTQLTL